MVFFDRGNFEFLKCYPNSYIFHASTPTQAQIAHWQVEVPASLPYSQKHEQIAVKDDSQWNEENKTAQHHRVAPIGQCVRDIIPCTWCHQAFGDIGAWKEKRSNSIQSIKPIGSGCLHAVWHETLLLFWCNAYGAVNQDQRWTGWMENTFD